MVDRGRPARHPPGLVHRRRPPQRRPHARPTLDAIAAHAWLNEIETTHLDRGYDYPKIRRLLTDAGLPDHVIQRRREPGDDRPKSITLGLRWIVEATNSWLSNYGQLRRSTDRKTCHRHAALCLATTVLIIGKLLTWRDRYSPRRPPLTTAYPLKS